jgi:hypothetical protein
VAGALIGPLTFIDQNQRRTPAQWHTLCCSIKSGKRVAARSKQQHDRVSGYVGVLMHTSVRPA